MKTPFELFKDDVANNVGDTELQQKIASARKFFLQGFDDAITQFSNLEMAKRRAAFARWKALENLDKYLIEFEANFIKAGGKIVWAQDADEAASEIIGIINRSGETSIVKSKSLTAEEIHLDEALKTNHKEWTETDLGQYILQLAEDKPTHMVMPAIHKSKKEVQQLFNQKFNTNTKEDAEQLSAQAAKILRTKYNKPGIGITGANFIIADQGMIAITENEGNVMLAAARPRIHIAIAGIDKVIPTLNDLHVLWPLLATFGTGQKITSYNSLIKGPRKNGESDGPEEMYLVLIDNGRSKVIAEELQRNVLTCIKCGACLYSDPVYSVIGARPYRSAWMGPPGNVVIPAIEGMKTHSFYNHLTTLSAADTEWCPVNINFNKLILEHRQKAVDQQTTPATEKFFYFLWKKAMLKRDIINWKSFKAGSFFMNNIFTKSSMGLRQMPTPAKETFNELWKKRMNGGN